MNLNNKKGGFALGIMALALVPNLATAQNESKSPGIHLEFMDTSVKPNEDFFRFVNGSWLDKTEIPSDRTRWGSFDELRQKTDNDALNILKDAVQSGKYAPNSDQGKAVSLYLSLMDTVARNKKGIAPIKPYLAKINAVKNLKDLQALLIQMEPEGGIGFLGAGVGTDAKNSNRNVVNVGLGSLGLPDRDYYVADDADSQEKRTKYLTHVARMFAFLGENPAVAQKNAERVLKLEIAMAEPRLNRVERRDRRKTYNPMTLGALQKLTPSFQWEAFFQGMGLPVLDTVIVSQPQYLSSLEQVWQKTTADDWKAYMRWTLLNRASNQLTTDIEAANFEFYGKILTGAVKQRPRDERVLQTINGTVGEALGKLYVEKMFPPEAKAKAEDMIKNVFLAFENRINNLPWMTKATRAGAIEKLRKSRVKIGYPDQWKDYSKLTIVSPKDKGNLFDNMKNITRWRFEENIAKLNEPVDKNEWFMAPQIVNAYYNPSFNEIVFPAAILQPPFYDYKADAAVNYGGIGAVIGHEISHGFDDSGSRYDADGNLVNWWTDEDLAEFTKLGGTLSDQYSQLEPLPGIFVDGKFTLGENIGDLGGVNAALDGLKLYLEMAGNPGLIDGFTPEQRFFISWATIWRTKSRDEYIKNQVKTDPHAPGMYRAYVPLQNMDAFYEAFNVQPGDGMFLENAQRVRIW